MRLAKGAKIAKVRACGAPGLLGVLCVLGERKIWLRPQAALGDSCDSLFVVLSRRDAEAQRTAVANRISTSASLRLCAQHDSSCSETRPFPDERGFVLLEPGKQPRSRPPTLMTDLEIRLCLKTRRGGQTASPDQRHWLGKRHQAVGPNGDNEFSDRA